MNLNKLMMAQGNFVNNTVVSEDNHGVGPQSNASTPCSRIWDLMRMYPPTFHCTKVDEDPQGFIDEVLKVVNAMGVTPWKKAELVDYMLKKVDQVWVEQ